ncbi:MAG: ABC transporter ATP-binding protein [Candidatus Tectomicrobia bacterium]|uniref:ABC transporter ATP-binding protein n=1 Tax=Tectimicrobiota bacterium TaxID=2528274 RepID=A0A932FYY1_UNCTE|nr:ABC transporter ATP-binding protein [Candidatus Tectomicrobia bacterium]
MIEIIELHKSFGENHVLRGVNLEIPTGESMVIIGGSGTGKSILLKHIIGLMKPDSGTVRVDGKAIPDLKETELDEMRKRFGMLFQAGALFDSLTVKDNVAFPLREHTHLSEEEIEARVQEKLEIVGLAGTGDLMPAELSGGMRKRAALARAIVMDPEILLFDEPTTGLDPILSDAINDLIVEMNHRLKVTSVTITHDMPSAYKIADRLAMLYEGRIIEIGTPEEIQNTQNPIVRQFITGSSVGPIKAVEPLHPPVGTRHRASRSGAGL